MTNELTVPNESRIRDKIYTIRGLQVMLDSDLAVLYNVDIKRLNEQVKRNIERFPSRFMFQLTDSEYKSLRSQFVTLEFKQDLRSQNATLEKSRGKHRKYLPYAFTEQGVAMLSGVLKSNTAIRVSIQIMDAFVAMRKFIATNAQIFQRLDHVEQKQIEYQIKTDDRFKKVFDAIESKDIKPKKGIFFDGQVFDAYNLVSDLVCSAKKSIILVDNYIDNSVLVLLGKRKKGASATVFTKKISEQLSLDLRKYNTQYPPITIREFKHSHDRFLIIDSKEVYHIGASLKDLGKKWFAFCKLDKEAFKLMEKLGLQK